MTKENLEFEIWWLPADRQGIRVGGLLPFFFQFLNLLF
jgi:hypothetical protein